jgi:hypothetical protein
MPDYSAANIHGVEDARRAAAAHSSPRYVCLDRLERYYESTQYATRRDFWDERVPLWERAPLVNYPIVRTAAQSNTDLVFGEGRFPKIRDARDAGQSQSEPDEENEKQDDQLTAIMRETRFKQHSRRSLSHAQTCKSVACLYGIRNGRLTADILKSKWCTPTFGSQGEVTKLEVQYPFFDYERDPQTRQTVMVCKLYRRVIDELADTVFVPIKVTINEDVKPSDWRVKEKVEHGFGFCPVVWYPFLRGVPTADDYDGIAIHEHQLGEIDALNMSLSQRHRAALWLGEPQVYEIGVEKNYNPTERGRQPRIAADKSGVPLDGVSAAGANSGWADIGGSVYGDMAGSSQGGRKKGPGYVWQYESDTAKVGLLELSQGSLKALDEHAADLRNKLAESLCVVFLDPENIKFAATTSGKALETLKQRQLDRCDQIRDDVEQNFLTPSLSMLVAIDQHRSKRNAYPAA